MSLAYTYDGSAFSGSIPPSSLSLTSMASGGDTAFGGFSIDDSAAAIVTVGHQAVTVEESACSQPRLFTGWTTERAMSRSIERGMIVGDDRLHDVTLVDLNALFGFRHIQGVASNRPDETWNQRVAWILGSDFLSGLIADTGHVLTGGSAWTCDAADYRGQYPSAVFSDLLDVSATYPMTYYAFWDPSGTAVGLYLGAEDGCIGTSTLSISNDPSEYNGTTCFLPSEDTVLARKPDQVYSHVTVIYKNGTKRLFRSRQSTAAKFIRRGTTYDVPRVQSDARAAAVAQAFLDRHDHEIDQITTTIRVPAASAGLVVAGQRITVKFSHLPDYTTTTSMRVVECSPIPIDDWAKYYDIRLVLELPVAVSSDQPCEDAMTTQEIEPNLSGTSTADGFVVYGISTVFLPIIPTPYYVGTWNFAAWNVGGVDYAGDCVQNYARIFGVGEGSLEIRTAIYSGGVRPVGLTLRHWNGTTFEDDEIQTGNSGDTFTFTVSSADGFCTHWVDLTDGPDPPCGGKWGFAGATWTAGGDIAQDQGNAPGSTLGEHPDVDIGTPVSGNALVYDSSGTAWVAGTPTMYLDWLADVGTAGVIDGDALVYDSATGTWGPGAADVSAYFGTPSIALGTAAATGTAPYVIRSDSTIVAFDGTVPSTQSFGDSAATGTAAKAARRDHKHGIPSIAATDIEAVGFVGPVLISDTPSTPLVFADLIQNEAQDDFVYADL